MFRRAVSRPVLLLVAVYTLAGGYLHLQLWLDGYRNIPSAVAGSWVVRAGFPLNTAGAVVVTTALLVATLQRRWTLPALLAVVGFNLTSLAVLIATRVGSVFGWSEPAWTPGAEQVRAVLLGALAVALVGVVGAFRFARTNPAPLELRVSP